MKHKFLIIPAAFCLLFYSCKKDWLDAKPKLSLVIPTTIADYQAILDNNTGSSIVPMAVPFNSAQSALAELGAADFYVSDNSLNAAAPLQRNTYNWARDIYEGDNNYVDYNFPYQRILFSNIVLEGIDKITPANASEQVAWNNVKGTALFFRAYSHYTIAQLFCKPYDKATAGSDLGIALKLQSDVNSQSHRATVQQTYDQVLADLKSSLSLLPVSVPSNQSGTTELTRLRPNKAAVNAVLARVYLSMSEFDSAYKYADNSLQLYNTLIDYNTLNTAATQPFTKFNAEVLFQMTLGSYSLFSTSNLIVDSTLYRSYNTNDLRRAAFFRVVSGNNAFKGSYDGSRFLSEGPCTDEVYLIRAEAAARKGDAGAAMSDLNTLLRKRWKTGTFTNLTASDANDALVKVLTERRKELCFRGLRWTDLRRLNREPAFAVTLKRTNNNKIITLPPNDPNYVLNIPPDVIQLSGMEQNPRH